MISYHHPVSWLLDIIIIHVSCPMFRIIYYWYIHQSSRKRRHLGWRIPRWYWRPCTPSMTRTGQTSRPCGNTSRWTTHMCPRRHHSTGAMRCIPSLESFYATLRILDTSLESFYSTLRILDTSLESFYSTFRVFVYWLLLIYSPILTNQPSSCLVLSSNKNSLTKKAIETSVASGRLEKVASGKYALSKHERDRMRDDEIGFEKPSKDLPTSKTSGDRRPGKQSGSGR